MVNNVINITADGNFQEVTGIPHDCKVLAIQHRASTAINMHFKGQSTVWTIKAGTTKVIKGQFNNGDIFLQAASGVIEVECATQTYADINVG